MSKRLKYHLTFVFVALFSLNEVSADDMSVYEFKVSYRMISAGHAAVVFNERNDTLTSKMNMNSSPWLSSLWQLADSIENKVDLRENRLISHLKIVNQGRYHRKYQVDFISDDSVRINGKVKARDAKGVMDVPQLLRHLETVDLIPGDTLHYRIWDGRAADKLSLLVRRPRKQLSINPLSKAPSVYVLSPLQSSSKSRKHGISLRIMVEEQLPHRPIRMEVKTRYGDIELTRQL